MTLEAVGVVVEKGGFLFKGMEGAVGVECGMAAEKGEERQGQFL